MAKLHPKTLSFLSSLKKNNNKRWFDKSRELFEAIRTDMLQFTSELLVEVNKFDTSIGYPDPKNCLFRINRDIRFSKDKTPYKNVMAIAISSVGKNFPASGMYLHFEPNHCFIAGGTWHPTPEQLKKIRQEIDYNLKDFKKIVESRSFKKNFGTLGSRGKLLRLPKDYSPENPAIEYLKYKSYTAVKKIPDSEIFADNFMKKAAGTLKQLSPFVRFLNEAVK